MLLVGARIYHTGHGEGEVIAHNRNTSNKYLLEKLKIGPDIITSAGLISLRSRSLHTCDLYPNIVQFDSGYIDVYSDNEVVTVD